MSIFANYAWASIIFACYEFAFVTTLAMARFRCKTTFLYVRLSWPPLVMPQHGAAIFYSHPPSSVNNMRQTGQQMLQMLFEGLPNIPLTIVTFKPRNTYMPTCINLLSVELSGQNKRQTMFVEMSIRLPFVNKWIRRTRRNS